MQNEMVGVEARLVCRPISGLGTKEMKVLISQALGAVSDIRRKEEG